MNSRTWITTIVTTVSLAVTLATASVGFAMMIKPGTVPINDESSATPHGGGTGGLPPEEQGRPPRNPIITGPVSRTETTLTVKLWDKSLYEQGYELYRGPSKNGPWTVIAFMNPFTGQFDFPDSGLSPDTPYCYRLRAFNAYGESFSSGNCFSTLDGRSVWRVQLRLRTANVADAGTDDSVRVQLNGPNLTWIDYGHNDFARGDDATYDLLLDGVSDLADIDSIYIHKEGTDGWCIESLALLVNSKEENPIEIYHQDFGSTAGTCLWIDKADGHKEYHKVSRSEMRAHPLWQTFQQPNPPTVFRQEELESRIESIIGDALHGQDGVFWGDLDGRGYVELSRLDDLTARVSVDLVADLPVSNPEVNLVFDLQFSGSCSDGQTPLQLNITAGNVTPHADFDWKTEWASGLFYLLLELVETHVAHRVEDAFPNLTKTITINADRPVCITPQLLSTHTLRLDLSFPPTGGTPPTKTGGTRPTVSPTTGTKSMQ